MLAPHVTGGSVSYIEQQFVTERQNGSMLVIERIRVDRAPETPLEVDVIVRPKGRASRPDTNCVASALRSLIRGDPCERVHSAARPAAVVSKVQQLADLIGA